MKKISWVLSICSFVFCSLMSVYAEPLHSLKLTPSSLEDGEILVTPVLEFSFPGGEFGNFTTGTSFTDGYRIDLKPGEGVFVTETKPFQTNGQPVVVTLEYMALNDVFSRSGPPQAAVVALNSPNGVPDGQLGYMYDKTSIEASKTMRLHVVYSPPSGQLLPSAQVTLSKDSGKPCSIALLSLSVYSFNPTDGSLLSVQLEQSFDEDPSDSIQTNVNNNQGHVQYIADAGQLVLSAPGGGEAANIEVETNVEISSINQDIDQIKYISINASRLSGDDGSLALIANLSSVGAGLFINNMNIQKHPESTKLFIGGNLFLDLPNIQNTLPILTYAQNGGGQEPSVIAIDNLKIETYSPDTIEDLEDLPADGVPASLASMLIIPNKLFSGSESSFSLTSSDINSHRPVSIPYSVSLTNGDNSVVLGEGITDSKGFSAKSFNVPNLEPGTWNVEVKTTGQTILSGQTAVANGGVLLIETDKPIYKPGQTIQGRVLLLNNSLAPLQGEVVLSISDAKGIKIHKETLAPNDYGVAAFELPLANELNYGTWKIQAQSGSDIQTESDIEVDRYVLPAFEVTLNLDKDWYLVNERITGAIESRYFFGKPVGGKIHVEALRYVSTWETYATVDGTLEDGRFAIDLEPVLYVAGTSGAEGDGTVQIKVTVTDDTGHEESTDQIVKIVDAGVALQLIPESPVIKPGLNQELLVVSETPGGKPLSVEVRLELNFVAEDGSGLGSVKETLNTENGIGILNYDVPAKSVLAVIAARTTSDGNEIEESLIQYAVYSPGANFIHLRQRNDGVLAVGSEAIFDLYATNPGTVYVDVFANGRTLFSKAVESNEIRFAVTPEMSPSAKLVAYMIQPNNEVSADVLPFDVELTAPTDLTVGFSAGEVKPGDPVSLSVQSGAGKSMVGLAIVDESVFALAEGRLNLRNVFAELERIFMEPQIEVHEDPNSWWDPDPIYAGQGTIDILRDNNLQIIASSALTTPEAKQMDIWQLWDNPELQKNLPPMMVPVLEDAFAGGGRDEDSPSGSDYQEPDRVRTFFPETWLWLPDMLTDADGNASLDLTAPDSITNWKLRAISTSPQGLGIGESELRVFQDFFVEPDLPYAVIRGDRFPMLVRIFNYLDDEQTIRVTLDNSEGLGLQDEAVKEITIPGNSAGSTSFTLQPDKVGNLPISLIAQSTSRADAIRKDLRVEPEGLRREVIHNGTLKEGGEISVELNVPLPEFRTTEYPDGIPFKETIVPDSEKLRVAITASFIGQSLEGLDDLLGMPYGCGEQNMIFLAPDIEVLRYLKASGQLAPAVRAKAEHFITTGYQRELTFRHNDGSFSAFGESDDIGSLWLTAFVLNTFSSAREVRTIDENVLSEAAAWIASHQKTDGSWEPVGTVIHQEMIGGLNGNLGLTAFVTIALLEYGQSDAAGLDKALAYLEVNLSDERVDSYVLSLIAYALNKADRPSADGAIDLLIEKAVMDSGMHWEPHSIETTAYAILTLVENDRIEAQSALTWLTAQRNSLGGYGNTQDTVVAFKALTAAAAKQSRDLDASIDVIVDGETVHTFSIHADNFDVLQTLELEPADRITLKINGSGTVLYQVAHAFNVPAELKPVGEDMMIKVDYSSEHINVDDIVDVLVSVDYVGIEPETGMAIIDVSVPTGFSVVQESLDKVREIDVVKRIEQAGRKTIFYLDKLVSGETFSFTYQVQALFPVKADSGSSSAYLYYDTETRAETGGTELIVD